MVTDMLVGREESTMAHRKLKDIKGILTYKQALGVHMPTMGVVAGGRVMTAVEM
jgi:hypothetical protein